MAVTSRELIRKSKLWILVAIVFCIHSAATSSVWDCTFEEDLCDWGNLLGAPGKWNRAQGSKGTTSLGPVYDHTYGNGTGWYLQSSTKGRATLQSRTTFKANQAYCFSFWILTNRAYNQSLQIKARDQQLFLINIGYQGDLWRSVLIELPEFDMPFKVQFSTPQTSNPNTDIALDDIVVAEGNCSKVGSNGFDAGLDLYYNDISSDFDWVSSRFSDETFQWLPKTDITQRSTRGSFAVASTNKTSKGKRATLWSPVLKSDSAFCTLFYLKIHGSDPGTIAVDLVSYSENFNITALSYTPQLPTNDWYGVARFPVLASESYQIRFTVIMGADGGWAFDGLETFPNFDACRVKPKDATGMITLRPLTTTPTTTTTSTTATTATTTHISTGPAAPPGKNDAQKSTDTQSAGWTVPVGASAGALALLAGVVVIVVVYRRRRDPAKRKDTDESATEYGSPISVNPIYGQAPTDDEGPTAFENPTFPDNEEEENEPEEITLPITIPKRDHSII